MKKLIVYDSLTGNTKKLADEIDRFFKEKNEEIEKIDIKKVNEEKLIKSINSADILFIGSWTDKGQCTDNIKNVYKLVKNKKIFVFATCGFGGDCSYYDKLFERVKNNIDESNEIIGNFYCQGKMPLSVKERYINMMKKNPEDRNLEVSLKNFEEALDHPNENDLLELDERLGNIKLK